MTPRIATGRNPCGAASGFGAVWVANYGSGTLTRVDPRTNRVTVSIRATVRFTSSAFGSMWVTSYARADVWRFRG